MNWPLRTSIDHQFHCYIQTFFCFTAFRYSRWRYVHILILIHSFSWFFESFNVYGGWHPWNVTDACFANKINDDPKLSKIRFKIGITHKALATPFVSVSGDASYVPHWFIPVQSITSVSVILILKHWHRRLMWPGFKLVIVHLLILLSDSLTSKSFYSHYTQNLWRVSSAMMFAVTRSVQRRKNVARVMYV